MCRIAGVWDFKNRESLHVLTLAESMAASMAHGGPDGHGSYKDEEEPLALGHRRLAVIDLSEAGAQPMQRGDLVVAYNGEIYNHQALRGELERLGFHFSSMSDTEVVLRAYEAWGIQCFARFSGMFAIAIWDSREKKIILARDRRGVKPFYWYMYDGILLFASEIKAFHQYPGFNLAIDQTAVSLYLQTGYIRAPHSIFTHVRKLEPATAAVITDKAETSFFKYWVDDFSEAKSLPVEEKTLVKQTLEVLEKGFRQRLVSDVPLGVFLSSGIDSSLVAATLAATHPELMTFTMGFEQAELNEAPLAQKLASQLGTRHDESICKEEDLEEVIPLLPEIYDEPFGDSSGIPTFLLARQARRKVKVVLSADGGDEIFGGYLRYRLAYQFHHTYRFIPRWIRTFLSFLISNLWQIGVFDRLASLLHRKKKLPSGSRVRKAVAFLQSHTIWEGLYAMSSLADKRMIASLHDAPFAAVLPNDTAEMESTNLVSEMGKVEMAGYLEGDILVKVDRASMYVGLEAREPFLDNDIVTFGLSLPDNLKIRDGKEKWIARKALATLIPAYFTTLPKKGFGVPLDSWLRNRFASQLIALTKDSHFCNTFRLRQEELNAIVRQYLSSKYTLIDPHFIWAIYNLHAWYKRWYVGYIFPQK